MSFHLSHPKTDQCSPWKDILRDKRNSYKSPTYPIKKPTEQDLNPKYRVIWVSNPICLVAPPGHQVSAALGAKCHSFRARKFNTEKYTCKNNWTKQNIVLAFHKFNTNLFCKKPVKTAKKC